MADEGRGSLRWLVALLVAVVFLFITCAALNQPAQAQTLTPTTDEANTPYYEYTLPSPDFVMRGNCADYSRGHRVDNHLHQFLYSFKEAVHWCWGSGSDYGKFTKTDWDFGYNEGDQWWNCWSYDSKTTDRDDGHLNWNGLRGEWRSMSGHGRFVCKVLGVGYVRDDVIWTYIKVDGFGFVDDSDDGG